MSSNTDTPEFNSRIAWIVFSLSAALGALSGFSEVVPRLILLALPILSPQMPDFDPLDTVTAIVAIAPFAFWPIVLLVGFFGDYRLGTQPAFLILFQMAFALYSLALISLFFDISTHYVIAGASLLALFMNRNACNFIFDIFVTSATRSTSERFYLFLLGGIAATIGAILGNVLLIPFIGAPRHFIACFRDISISVCLYLGPGEKIFTQVA